MRIVFQPDGLGVALIATGSIAGAALLGLSLNLIRQRIDTAARPARMAAGGSTTLLLMGAQGNSPQLCLGAGVDETHRRRRCHGLRLYCSVYRSGLWRGGRGTYDDSQSEPLSPDAREPDTRGVRGTGVTANLHRRVFAAPFGDSRPARPR